MKPFLSDRCAIIGALNCEIDQLYSELGRKCLPYLGFWPERLK